MSGNPSIQRRRLGLILRQLRLDADKTCEQVGTEMERTGSWVSRIEGGHHKLRVRDLNGILDILGFDNNEERRKELAALAAGGKGKGWWNKYGSGLAGQYATYIGFEDAAATLLSYDLLVIPGILQTEEYLRALFEHGVTRETADVVDRKVQIRMARQERLRNEVPLQVRAILDEAVLRRSFGGNQVLAGQLKYLVETATKLPNVTLQVVPLSQPINTGMVCSFGIMEFADMDPEVVFSEGLTGTIYEEEADARRCISVFGELRSAALSPAESIKLIKRILGELK